jgi:mono/diheme cytochrome c family protein
LPRSESMRLLLLVLLSCCWMAVAQSVLVPLAAAATQAPAATKKPASTSAAKKPGAAAKPAATKPAEAAGTAAPKESDAAAPYTVKDGTMVDPKTLQGWKTWRALACERCHGAAQEGLVGPPLVESMKKLSKDEFKATLEKGRIEKGMPPFNTSQMVMQNWEGLYAYLKGRSDGQIKPGKLTPIP